MVYYFANAMNKSYPSAYEAAVEFDNLLLRQRRQRHRCARGRKSLKSSSGKAPRPRSRGHEHGNTLWDTRSCRRLGAHTFLQPLQFKAATGWFRCVRPFKGAVRRPGRDEGNISVCWFDHGGSG